MHMTDIVSNITSFYNGGVMEERLHSEMRVTGRCIKIQQSTNWY